MMRRILLRFATPTQIEKYETLYKKNEGSATVYALRLLDAYFEVKSSRKQNIYKKYNLSELEYSDLVSKQSNRCAICGNRSRLCVDHDHSSQRVRGLLCANCNLGIGNFKDNVFNLLDAIAYLRKGERYETT